MDSLYRGILQLVYAALTGEGAQLPPDFDWERAYPFVTAHQIAPLVYEGARLCGVDTQTDVMRGLFRDYCQEIVKSERQTRAVDELRAAFDEAGIEHLFFKGVVLKERYPKPELRPMGDADVLIREAQYPAVDDILCRLGYELKAQTAQEWHYASPGLIVEPHRMLVDPEDARDASVFGTGWELTAPDGAGRPTLPPEVETAHLVSHLAKHFRVGGAGLRQMIDLWVCRRAHAAPDERKLAGLLDRLGLAEFYANVLRALSCWFEGGAEDEVTELLTRFVFSSGSFGTERSQVLAVTLRRTGGRGVKTYGVFSRLFPARSALIDDYPWLARRPLLLPFAWARRLFRLIFFHRRRIRSGLRRMSMVNAEDVRGYAELLDRIGLGGA